MNFKSLIIKTSEQEEFKFKPIKKLLRNEELNIDYGVSNKKQYKELEKIIKEKYKHIYISCTLQEDDKMQIYRYVYMTNMIDSDLDKIYFEQENNNKILLRDYMHLCNMIQSPICTERLNKFDKYCISNQDTLQKAQIQFGKYINKHDNEVYYRLRIDTDQIYPNLCLDY